MNRRLYSSGLLLLLAGCSSPQTQIRSALLDAGLSKPMASCMAIRMADQLSYAQLWKLRDLKNLKSSDARSLSVEEFMKNSKSLQDPKIMAVITKSGVICAITG